MLWLAWQLVGVAIVVGVLWLGWKAKNALFPFGISGTNFWEVMLRLAVGILGVIALLWALTWRK